MTTDEPIEELRRELLAAAYRRTAPSPAAASSEPARRWKNRKVILSVLTGLLVAAPATAAITGALPSSSGTTPDGSSYTVQQTTTAGSVCDHTDFRDANGQPSAQVQSCAPSGATIAGGYQPSELEVGFTVAPGQTVLVRGTVSMKIVRVTVTGASEPVTLTTNNDGRQAFTALSTDRRPTVRAYDEQGHEVQSFTVPL